MSGYSQEEWRAKAARGELPCKRSRRALRVRIVLGLLFVAALFAVYFTVVHGTVARVFCLVAISAISSVTAAAMNRLWS